MTDWDRNLIIDALEAYIRELKSEKESETFTAYNPEIIAEAENLIKRMKPTFYITKAEGCQVKTVENTRQS
jgi:hypothetical protein